MSTLRGRRDYCTRDPVPERSIESSPEPFDIWRSESPGANRGQNGESMLKAAGATSAALGCFITESFATTGESLREGLVIQSARRLRADLAAGPIVARAMPARRICRRVVASLFAMHLCRRHSRVPLLIVPCSCLRLSGTPCNSLARKPPRVYHIWRKTAPAFVNAKLIGSKVKRHFFRSRQCVPEAGNVRSSHSSLVANLAGRAQSEAGARGTSEDHVIHGSACRST
jgi:hypothetical protein